MRQAAPETRLVGLGQKNTALPKGRQYDLFVDASFGYICFEGEGDVVQLIVCPDCHDSLGSELRF
ncbi:hypothetical protein OUZ56_009209 [Daphnia magna]|uniref:Uncharacterized protein n=1 Tax=Daphnia magna TaxID=35525 RepID=A0ABR0AFB1_9CRUS|nr:hypothetical protein OUZ56_009209 [Daphnia magna]